MQNPSGTNGAPLASDTGPDAVSVLRVSIIR